MIVGKVYNSEINNLQKFSPEFYLNEGKRQMVELQRSKKISYVLSDIVRTVFRPGLFKRIFIKDEKRSTLYFTASDMMTENPLYYAKNLSNKLTKDADYMTVHNHYILVSCAGTVGNVRLISNNLDNTIASQDIIRIVPNEENFGFIYAYLQTDTVYSYLQSLIYGSVVPRIEPDSIKKLPVVNINKDIVASSNDLINQTINMREQAMGYLNEAKDVLNNYINCSIEKTEGSHYTSRNIKDIRKSLRCRMDPPALINNSVLHFENIKSKCVRLGTCNVNIFRPGIFKRTYVKHGIPYIKGSEIFNLNPFKRCETLSKTKTPFVELMKLKERQILITCAGSIGQIKYITKEYEDKEAIGSQDIIRLESNDNLFTPEFLFIYLQTPLAFDYMQSMKYGSVIERIEPFHVESIPVIIPSQSISQKITSLVKKYSECMYQAFCYEEQAVSQIENEIQNLVNL